METEVGMVTLEEGDFGWDYILRHQNGRTRLIQIDTDYPSVAASFGWNGDCKDINGAREYLDDHIGDEIEDPGWFD